MDNFNFDMEKFLLIISEIKDIAHLIDGLKENNIQFQVSCDLNEIDVILNKRHPNLVIVKDKLEKLNPEQIITKIVNSDKSPYVVVFSEKADVFVAKKFLDLGVFDFWIAPLILEKILVFFKEQNKENFSQNHRPKNYIKIVGEHKKIKLALALAKKIAPSNATVLICGESGTGKELIAKYIHINSKRARGPFVAVNCAALPENLLESELFGYEKGAFTGAYKSKPGKFELASGGTILLDEISEMNLTLQAKLLRVIQEKEVDRLGGVQPIKVDVRIIATTNRNLKEYVDQGNFRQDLYFRLNVIPIHLPPLRERGEDVILLANYFLEKFSLEYNIQSPGFSEESIRWMKNYNWPGNIRELENLVERAILIAQNSYIEPRHLLMDSLEEDLLGEKDEKNLKDNSKKQNLETSQFALDRIIPLEELEKHMIIKSLEKTRGNRTKAAELLGISVRTLRNKLNKLKQEGITL